MRLMLQNQELTDVISSRIGPGSCILFKYGPGSGGDYLLKQFFTDAPEGTYSVYITTYETEEEIREKLEEKESLGDSEVISVLPVLESGLSDTEKRDKFLDEGIMVTDLLEISSSSFETKSRFDTGDRVLSVLTATSRKQILPFRMVIDSIHDIASLSSAEDLVERILIIRKALREKGGIVILGSPLDWDVLKHKETTLFDAVMEGRTTGVGDSYRRTLLLKNIRGSPERPEEWEIHISRDIPTAISVD